MTNHGSDHPIGSGVHRPRRDRAGVAGDHCIGGLGGKDLTIRLLPNGIVEQIAIDGEEVAGTRGVETVDLRRGKEPRG